MSTSKGYSQLDSFQESMYIGMVYGAAIGLTISVIILFSLCGQGNKIKNRKSFTFALLSIICSLLIYLTILVFQNDLLFAWQLDDEHFSYVEFSEIIGYFFYIFGKITFYCSFTYYVLSEFDSYSKTKNYLTVWMIIACLILVCLGIVSIIDDISEQALKEIGVTSKHNIHLSMPTSHEGANYTYYAAFITIIIDLIYFGVLIYNYIKAIKQTNNENGIKGVILMCMSCLIFWVFLITVIFAPTSLGMMFNSIDIISDDICLFLMFEQQTKIYQFWCKGCNACCFKFVFGSKGHATANSDDCEDQKENISLI